MLAARNVPERGGPSVSSLDEEMYESFREVEVRLARGERLMRVMAGVARIGAWEIDVARGTLFWSRELYELHELEPGTPIDAERAINFIAPEARSLIREQFYKMSRGAVPGCDLTVPLVTARGRRRWVRALGHAEWHNGSLSRMTGAYQDVTEHIETQMRLDRAIRGTQDGLWEEDLTNGNLWVSPRYRELLGYPEAELPDGTQEHSWQKLLHAHDRERIREAVQIHLEHGAPLDIEIRLRAKSGAYRWFRARATAERDGTGRPRTLSGSIVDITSERNSREALIAAKEAAAAADRSKSQFLANMSHEIRTPMNGVLGMTELLLDTALGATQRELVQTIRASATSLLNVLNDLLDFSKIEAGKLDIESVPMDVRQCVEEVGALMAVQASSKGLELIVNVDPAIPERVLGDPHRVRQVLVNLCGNAVKFTRDGEIVIELIPVRSGEGAPQLRFEVRDSGIGIPQEALGRLFHPFTQIDAATTRHFGGTGLGLSIVKRLVELMGGEVRVDSTVGRGSTFTVTLPCQPVEDAQGQNARVAVDLGGKRVLVVDDNATNLRVVRGQLECVGLEVTTTSSADAALELLERARTQHRDFDLAILDDRMPVCDGSTLGRRILATPGLKNIRLVMLTSVDGYGSADRLSEIGFSGYLPKPVRGRELRACIARVLQIDTGAVSARHRIVTRSVLAALADETAYQGRVLVVEDNAVNQQVAQRFLERLGCKVTVASNGEEAVEMLGRGGYDLVLMDVQMPVMDGLEATRRVRARENGGVRTPIVALTASAMADELERCTAAGMDGLLTKPLEVARLRAILERFGLEHGHGSATPTSAPPVCTDSPLDAERLRALVGPDPVFLAQVSRTFGASMTALMAELHAAAATGESGRLQSIAHKMRGSGASVFASRLTALAGAVEQNAPALAPEDLRARITALQQAVDECVEFLQGLAA